MNIHLFLGPCYLNRHRLGGIDTPIVKVIGLVEDSAVNVGIRQSRPGNPVSPTDVITRSRLPERQVLNIGDVKRRVTVGRRRGYTRCRRRRYRGRWSDWCWRD